jgi:hypothetical protein
MTEHDPAQDDREQHIRSLVTMLSRTDIETRWKAAHDLARLGDPVAIPLLAQTVIDGEHDASRAAAYVLTQVGPPGVDWLVGALNDGQVRLRGWAAAALSTCNIDETVKPERIRDRLLTLMDDPDPGVRRAAGSTLRLMGEWVAAPTALSPAAYAGTVYADHHQFFFCDRAFDGDVISDTDTDPDAFYRAISDGPRTCLHLHTSTYGVVPIRVEVMDADPQDEVERWDHVAEASLEVSSGGIVFWELFDEIHHEPDISLPRATYRVRMYCGNLTDPEYGDEDDYYRLVLWPSPYRPPTRVYTLPSLRRSR